MTTMVKRIKEIVYDDELDAIVLVLEVEGERLQLGFTAVQAEQLVDEIYAWLERDEEFEDDLEDEDLELDW